MIFEKASVPMTSAWRYCVGADSIMLCATLSANTKPAHTEFTSNAGHLPLRHPELFLQHARDRRLRLIRRRARDDDQIDRRLVDARVARGSASAAWIAHVARGPRRRPRFVAPGSPSWRRSIRGRCRPSWPTHGWSRILSGTYAPTPVIRMPIPTPRRPAQCRLSRLIALATAARSAAMRVPSETIATSSGRTPAALRGARDADRASIREWSSRSSEMRETRIRRRVGSLIVPAAIAAVERLDEHQLLLHRQIARQRVAPIEDLVRLGGDARAGARIDLNQPQLVDLMIERSWIGGFCENRPSQYTPRPGTGTARNISGIAADASRHSTQSSSPGEQLEVTAQHLDRADLQHRRAGPAGQLPQLLEVEVLVEDVAKLVRAPRRQVVRADLRAAP